MTTSIPSSDDFLDRAIHAITSQPSPAFERDRAIDRALTAHATRHRTKTTPLTPFRAALLRWSIAAAFFIVAGTMVLPMLNNARKFSANGYANEETRTPAASTPAQGDLERAAYKLRPSVHILVAEKASVLIANGPAAELKLGAEVPGNQTSAALHVWNWSKSSTSQIVPDADAYSIFHAAISPNGQFFVEANGKIHSFSRVPPGNPDQNVIPRKSIDLGGAEYREGASTYTRIGEMRFSPDGSRLAMLVTLPKQDKTVHEVIQIVDFSTEQVLCEFPAGEAYALRIALSEDGKQIAAADPQRKISLRECATGKVVREFDPPLKTQVMSIAISPDGKGIAASDRGGTLMVWSTDTGNILWQTDITKLPQSPGSDAMELLRFSPDGQFLAGRRWGKVNVFNAATGHLEGTISSQSTAAVQWSDDSKFITIVTTERNSSRREEPPTAIYPTVQQFDWRTGKAIAAP